MKKLILLTVFALFSCSNDNTEEKQIEKSNGLIGRWYYESMAVNNKRMPYTEDFSDCPIPKEEYIEFSENGSFETFYYTDCEDDLSVGKYSLTGKRMRVSIDDQVIDAEIKELSFTSLVFQFEDDWDSDGETDTVIQQFIR